MEFVFYRTLATVKTFFGIPLTFLKFIGLIGGFSFLIDIKIGIIVTIILFFITKTLFTFVKDKEIVEIFISNLENPRKLGF